MKQIWLFLIVAQFSLLSAQDTLFYDSDWNKVPTPNKARFIKILKPSPENPDQVEERTFFISGQQRSIRFYSSDNSQLYVGQRKEWYENGQIRKKMTYVNGQLDGELTTYYDNGQLKRKEYYDMGEFLNGECWTSKGISTEHFDFIVLPKFPGGMNELVRFIASNTRYPKKSKSRGIEGVVIANFVIDTKGNVTDIKIIQSINKELDKEAIRVIKKMPRWQPGMEDGEIVKVSFNLPFSFKLR